MERKQSKTAETKTVYTHKLPKKMPKISTQFSIIVLNISGLEFLIKRYILVEWIKKQNISFCCLKETQI